MNKQTKKFLYKYKSIIGLVLFSIIISLLSDRFLTVNNILNVLRQTSVNAIIAAGMTFIILTGGIDLSVGSSLAIAGAITAKLVLSGFNVYLAILIGIIVGVLVGIFNGLVISKGKVQPFIATLATMTMIRGYTLVFTNGRPISIGSAKGKEVISFIGRNNILGIPVPIYLMIIVFMISYFVLKHTKFGRYVYALGGNEEATLLSGINIDKVKLKVYAISGGLSALAGIVVMSRLLSAQPQAGSGYELDAIAAVVLGGTSLAGGIGSIAGTVVGALIIGILNNALNLMNVSSYYQLLAKGLVILIAVLLDRKQN